MAYTHVSTSERQHISTFEMRYYTDENISKALVNTLLDKGFDVLSCQEAGMLTTSDVEQLLFVAKEKRIIITRDDDFIKWHKKGAKHAGIIYIHPKMPDADVVKGIIQINDTCARQIQRKARRLYVIQYKPPSSFWSKLKRSTCFQLVSRIMKKS